MAEQLTEDEVLGIRVILRAVTESKVSPDGVAAILKAGDLTRQLTSIEDRISLAQGKVQQAQADAQAEIGDLDAQRQAILAERKKLVGG